MVVEAVGRPETFKQAFYARDLAGTVVLVGVPTPDMKIELPLIDVFGRGGAIKSSWYGDCLPSRDFPMLVDLHLQGRLPLEKFVSETIGLDDVEAAFEKMHQRRGAALGGGVLMPPSGRSTTSSPPARSRSTAAPGTSTTTSGWSATRTRCSSSTPRTTRTRSPRRSATGGWWPWCARTRTTTT